MHTLLRQRPGRPLVSRMAYGVATNNIFALLDEENEDPQALASKPVEHDETSQAKKEPTPKAKEVPKTAGAHPSAHAISFAAFESIQSSSE